MAVPDTAPRREGTPHAPDAPGTPGPRELIAAAQAGDPEARRRMVEANMRLVHAIVRRFTSRLHGGAAGDAEDLFQVGCLGLLKALDGFDVSRPVRFSTYAVPVIVGELRRYLREQHPVRVSRGLRDVGMRVAACRQQLSQAWGRSPSVEEVSSALGLSREEVAAAESALQPPESLDRLAEEGRAGVPGSGEAAASEDEGISGLVESYALRQALAGMEPWERQLVALRYLGHHSQTEVARALGVSQAHVSRAERRILQRLRHLLT